MSIPYYRRPWIDGSEEHYRDDEPEDWSDMTSELDDEEPISEDCMIDDFNRAVDELRDLYPKPDDHDRRFDDLYSQQNGDIGDHELPPY